MFAPLMRRRRGRAHEGREHLSRRGLRRRDHEHHDGRGSGGRHDRHRKRGEGAAHRRSRQLPQLHGQCRKGELAKEKWSMMERMFYLYE